ncbi:hypothetical protein CYMTET_53947 [Cymbomonas tetramitiformis]|uniref:Uncharacterized protein n=1 Tax=Cymbomonas tetramitiformis TaxID=36881 RepID=A0AAE0BH47_9CHLO|nr:hypothetical protein CYMTET_53947 [Cymbomonas tetramitiformis]
MSMRLYLPSGAAAASADVDVGGYNLADDEEDDPEMPEMCSDDEEDDDIPLEEMPAGVVDGRRAGLQATKLVACLAEGMALVSAWGVLMLYRAILYDTGANCNIIPIRKAIDLGLVIYDVETAAKVTRCDGSPTAFTKYCYVEVVLAAGTPHMTLHRLPYTLSSATPSTPRGIS